MENFNISIYDNFGKSFDNITIKTQRKPTYFSRGSCQQIYNDQRWGENRFNNYNN